MARFAIYFAPDPAGALWRFGCGVIGYDAATGADVAFATTGLATPQDWAGLTAEPRRYGFHATLKAPFEPASGVTADDVLVATERVAASLDAIPIERLTLAQMGRFVALVPSEPSPRLHAMAEASVVRLDGLRAPLAESDRARRMASPLTARQIALLDQYGYPYVLEQFRFHMTLTGAIAMPELRGQVEVALRALYEARVPLGPLWVDRIAVFHQPERDQRFRILQSYALNRR